MCFNDHYKGEEDDLDLNFCGKHGSHTKKLVNYEKEIVNPPFQGIIEFTLKKNKLSHKKLICGGIKSVIKAKIIE